MTSPAPASTPVNDFLYDSDRMDNPRLSELMARFDAAYAEAARADAALEQIKNALKAELTTGAVKPDGTPYERYHLTGSVLEQPLTLRWKVTNRLETARLRQDHPEIAAAYTRASGAWEIRRDK